MKNETRAVALVLAMLLGAAPAAAQDAKSNLVVAVVDGNVLSQQAKIMKSAQEEAEKLAKRFEQDFTNQENRLKKEFEDLQKKRLTMPGAEYDQKVQALNQRAVENRRTAQVRQQQMALSVRQLQVKFREEVVNITKALAVEDGFTIVFDKAAALHVAPQFDITSKVLARLDKSTATIKFEFPPKAEPGADPGTTGTEPGKEPAKPGTTPKP